MRLNDKRLNFYTWKPVALYVLFGCLWMSQVSIVKGGLFLLCTTALFYILVRKDFKTVHGWNYKFKDYFEQALVGIVALNSEGAVINLNAAAIKILSRDQSEMESHLFFEGIQISAYPDLNPIDLEMLRREEEKGLVAVLKTPVGQLKYLHLTASNQSDGCVVILTDITEKVLMEESLMEMNIALEDKVEVRTAELKKTMVDLEEASKRISATERMTALGELASGIADEINTPVGVAITAVSYMGVEVEKLEGAFEEGCLKRSEMKNLVEALEEAHDLARRNLEKASEVIGSFKQMSADIHSNQKRYFKVSEIISDTIVSLRPFVRKGDYRFDLHQGADEPIFAYPGVISQILSNLILNAIQHGFSEKQEGTMAIHTRVENYKLIMDFQDNGKGIAPEHRVLIFNPYYKIHEEAETAGLGLSILSKLVKEELGGEIECYEAPIGGAGFRVVLPVADVNENAFSGPLHRL